jgi:hypothetical protein
MPLVLGSVARCGASDIEVNYEWDVNMEPRVAHIDDATVLVL